MIKLPLFLLLLIAVVNPGYATVIRGKNEAYAGHKIDFYRYTDPVSLQKEKVFTVSFGTEGNFEAEVPVNKNEFVFADFGIYRGMLILKPEDEFTLRFPPLREKSFADEKNPYFEPVSFWFETVEKNQITDRISAFDNRFNQLTDKYFNYLYFRQSREVYDTVVAILNQQFQAEDSPVLQQHRKYRLMVLKTDAFRLKTSVVAEAIEGVDSWFLTFPSFIEFFEKVFSNQLSFEAKTVDGKPVMNAVAGNDFHFLLDFVRNKYKLNESAAKLALVKMLHDGFYSGDFSERAIFDLLHSKELRSDAIVKDVTQHVISKLEFLMPGSKAPVICLKNVNGFEVCTDELSEKYKYILFADTEMIVCREHLKYLSEIQDKFGEHLEIVIVLRKTDLIEMKIFLDKQEIPGIKLVDTNGKYIDEYRVQSFPTAFLLNENHEVVFAHTKTPLDGFEQQFAPYLRRKLFEAQRNQ